MTTSPITNLLGSLVPGATTASTGQPATDGSTADAFLALVQGLLDGAAASVADPAAPATAPADGTTDLTVTPETTDLEAPAVDLAPTGTDPATAGAAVVVPAFVPQAIQIQPAAPEASAPIEAVTSVASAAVASATVATTAAATSPLAVAATVAPSAAKAAAPASDRAPAIALPADGPAPAPSTAANPTKLELPDVAVQAVEPGRANAEQPAAQQAAPAPAAATPAQAPSVAPVSGVAPVATNVVVTPPTDTHQVTQQVFPEVVRIVNNPAGPQRLTIKLNPEALGEVRVVLTQGRHGLEVSLSGGADARAAITDGAGELQRLLDQVGRGDSRIVVRDLTGTAPATTVSQPAATSSGSGVPTDLAGGAGTGTGRPGGDAAPGQQSRHHAPGSTNATDGTPSTTNPSLSTESVTRTQPGLDVTM